MTTISLKGLKKAEVLAALYNASKPQGMGFIYYDSTPMKTEEAESLLERQTDFDYLKGRVMKVDLSGEELDPRGYDCDNGDGAAAAAIRSLQETGNANNEAISKVHSDRTFLSAVEVQAHLDEKSEMVYALDGTPVLGLGLGDFKEQLEPKVKKAKEDNQNK